MGNRRRGMLAYRACKLREKHGMTYEEALERARVLLAEEGKQRSKASAHAARARKKAEAARKFKVTPTVHGRVVSRLFQGGAPGTGKKS
ncbi:hypothetical protein T5B8_19293 [Salinisphaera sp. T5B8]|uniref:hypothetical protein n=1 Tax=Salinisphaera sp. T5B8 TaxID=1304154 RepID=UPI003342AAAA